MNVNRVEFLETLKKVQPGLASRENIEQSQCFVFSEGEPVGRTSSGETEKARQSWKKLFKDA